MLFAHPKLQSASVIVSIAAATASIRFLIFFLHHSPSLKPTSTAICRSSVVSIMSSSAPLVVICSNSPKPNELARSLQSKWKSLKLLVDGENEEVRVLLHSDLDADNHMTFETGIYMKTLLASHIGWFVIWSPRVPSTHDIVSQNFCELPIGTVCVADTQFKGRGRGKNVWESPVGCLLFSFTVQMEDGRKLPLLQYVVSLAVTEAIKEACQAKGLQKLNVRIKWPNDLYLNGLKVGGILCTSKYSSKKFNVCTGIGLNIDNEKPTTSLNAALREISSVSSQLTREEILAAFFNKFEELYEVFLSKGFQVLEKLYYQTWLHRKVMNRSCMETKLQSYSQYKFVFGKEYDSPSFSALLSNKNWDHSDRSSQKVVIEEKPDGQSAAEIAVTIQGLTPAGYLLATDEDNNNYELHPDGNSFDFFKGLMRTKLVQ